MSSVLLRSSSVTHQPLTEHKRSSNGADDKKQLLIFIRIVGNVHFQACRSQNYTNQTYKLKQTWCELRPAPFKLRDTPAFDGAQTEFRRSWWQEAIAYFNSNCKKCTFSSTQKSKIHKSIGWTIKQTWFEPDVQAPWKPLTECSRKYKMVDVLLVLQAFIFELIYIYLFIYIHLAKGPTLFAWFLFPNWQNTSTILKNCNSSCRILSYYKI